MTIVHRFLAAAALLLAIAGLLAGEIEHSAATISNHQIDVFELAGLIKNREVLLTDLRSPADIDEFTLPGALGLSDTLTVLESLEGEATVVVFGYEQRHSWHPIQASGHQLRFLSDGVEQWLTHILRPVVYRFAPDSELASFEAHADLSRYFGGIPRYSNEPVQPISVADRLSRVRRGCGF